MTPITIEPNSGVKMAGVKVISKNWSSDSSVKYIEIIYVSESFLLAKLFSEKGFMYENSLGFGGDWYLYEEPKPELTLEQRIERLEAAIENIGRHTCRCDCHGEI